MFQFDPRSPEFRDNPYPFYDKLRAMAPIFYWEEWDTWFLTRHEDCTLLLRNKRLGNKPSPGDSMLYQNPPDHTRLRSLVNKAFTSHRVEQFRGRIQEITDHLLDQLKDTGQADLIASLAYPLPVIVIAEMLGVPPEDHVIFQNWSKMITKSLDLADNSAIADQIKEAIESFKTYFKALIAERRANPKEDLISALAAAEEAGDKLTEAELYNTCRLLLIAGHETTVNLIGNGTLALLRYPHQLQGLKDNPDCIGSAIEEFLRYDSPIQMTSRLALETVPFKGHTFRTGQTLAFLLGAANRDPEAFEQPNTLDLTRPNNRHLSFSQGIHYCLGAPLARLEGQIAISTLIRRFPNLALATTSLTYCDNYVFRGLERLWVSY
ncbi:MAG: cytochrome P450 [Chloroflexi bacterium]|nr:cytochrome P450 [Chloroflexota bacterium]